MLKKAILIILTLLSVLYCFRLGYIWTPYGHGGKFFIGLHFPLVMTITAFAYSKLSQFTSMKEKLFLFGIIYFLTVASFSLTIEYLINTKKDYFHFLYYESGGYVDKIFFVWLGIGFVFLCTVFYLNKKNAPSDRQI
jgi:hypothetical protein